MQRTRRSLYETDRSQRLGTRPAISILALPTASLAEGCNMATVSADNFQLIVGESTLDIDATLRMSAGIGESLGRGLLVADVLGGNANVLQVLLAMEDSQINASRKRPDFITEFTHTCKANSWFDCPF